MPNQLNTGWALKRESDNGYSDVSTSYFTGMRNSSKTDTTW